MNIAVTIDNVPPLPSASEAGPAPKRIVVGFGSAWITDSGSSSLYRVTPKT